MKTLIKNIIYNNFLLKLLFKSLKWTYTTDFYLVDIRSGYKDYIIRKVFKTTLFNTEIMFYVWKHKDFKNTEIYLNKEWVKSMLNYDFQEVLKLNLSNYFAFEN